MIHNHEVPGSIPGLATEAEKVEKLSPFFVLYSILSIPPVLIAGISMVQC